MPNDDAAEFYGVPHGSVVAIGRLVIAAGIVERTARDILLDLGEAPGKKMAANVLDSIQGIARRGLPAPVAAHALTSASDLRSWTARAKPLLEARNTVVHAAPVTQKHDDGWVLMSQHLRSGRLSRSHVDALRGLAEELSGCARAGRGLHFGLLRSPREPIFVRNTLVPGEAWVIVHHGDDPAVPRPTDAEQDRWWCEMPPFWTLREPPSERP